MKKPLSLRQWAERNLATAKSLLANAENGQIRYELVNLSEQIADWETDKSIHNLRALKSACEEVALELKRLEDLHEDINQLQSIK